MAPPVTSVVPLAPGSEGRAAAQCRRVASARRLRRIIAVSIAAGLAVLFVERAMAAGNKRGAQLAAMCASCHRLDGRGKAIPSIVGMDKASLTAAMAGFKSGTRSSHSQIMHAVALSLTDGEIATLAEYFAALPKETKRP